MLNPKRFGMDTFWTERKHESEMEEEWYIVGRSKPKVVLRSGAVVIAECEWS